MKVRFELTDTFGGEANYSWVRREELKLPDGTGEALVNQLAREWAGWRGRRTTTELSNDTTIIRPRGLLQVLFVTWCTDDA